MDYELAREIQRICAGETRELERGQIVEDTLDIEALTREFNEEKTGECRAFYEELAADKSVKPYDVDSLLEEKESIRQQFEEFCREHRDSDIFRALYDDVGDFFLNPPFEGLDQIEYGVNEVCVFSLLEYFACKASPGIDDERCRQEYRDSIERRTSEPVAEHWIGIYDDLQRRYTQISKACSESAASSQETLAACCIVAIAAIRDQDAFALDMAQQGAVQRAVSIMKAYRDENWKGGESAFTDNVVRLFEFIWSTLRAC